MGAKKEPTPVERLDFGKYNIEDLLLGMVSLSKS